MCKREAWKALFFPGKEHMQNGSVGKRERKLDWVLTESEGMPKQTEKDSRQN